MPYLVILRVADILLDQSSPGVGKGTQPIGKAVLFATEIFIDHREVKMVDKPAVYCVGECASFHISSLNIDCVAVYLKVFCCADFCLFVAFLRRIEHVFQLKVVAQVVERCRDHVKDYF